MTLAGRSDRPRTKPESQEPVDEDEEEEEDVKEDEDEVDDDSERFISEKAQIQHQRLRISRVSASNFIVEFWILREVWIIEMGVAEGLRI